MKSTLFTSLACLIFSGTSTYSDFTIGVIPDTQNLSESDADGKLIEGMTRFFVEYQAELNVRFVISLGDMTQNQNTDSEWRRVKNAYDLLAEADIPYAPCQGNHDGIPGINKWFPVSEFQNTPTWGESMNGGIENANYLFSANDMDFVLVLWQWNPPGQVVTWVQDTFQKHSGRRGITAAHNIEPGGGDEADIVESSDNVFLSVVGHSTRNDGEDHWTSTSPSGKTQDLILTDYQARPNKGATVRYYTFKPNEDEICAFTYSITARTYETDASSQFCFPYDMEPFTEVVGPASVLELKASPDGLAADGSVATITAKIKDAEGRLVKDFDEPITFSVSEGGTLVGDNIIVPMDARAEIQVSRESGPIRITASGGGLIGHVDINVLVNVIENPSFEIEGNNASDAAVWIEGSGHTRTSEEANTGSFSMKSTTNRSSSRVSVPVKPGETYLITAAIKNSSGGNAAIDMNDIPGELTLKSSSTDWNTVSDYWTNSNNLNSITLRLLTDGGSTLAYFDDVMVLEQTDEVLGTLYGEAEDHGSLPFTGGYLNLASFNEVNKMTVHDMMGRILMNKTIPAGQSSAYLGDLPQGQYIYKISTADKVHSGTFLNINY